MESKILVIYVGVAGIRSEDIDTFTNRIAKKVIPTTFEGEIIVIPTQSLNTVIDCINPKYITDAELIKEHIEMIKKINEQLQYQLEELKKKNNE